MTFSFGMTSGETSASAAAVAAARRRMGLIRTRNISVIASENAPDKATVLYRLGCGILYRIPPVISSGLWGRPDM